MLIKTKGSASHKQYQWEILHLEHGEENVIHRLDGFMVKYPLADPLLMIAYISNWDTSHVYIDTESNTNVIFQDLFDKMKISLSTVKHSSKPTYCVGETPYQP